MSSSKKALKLLNNWGFALVFPIFLVFTLFSDETLNLLFGANYSSAALALSILAFGNLFTAAFGGVSNFLKSKGYTKIFLKITSLSVAANILLNIYLVPRLGINGAALSTMISVILGGSLLFIQAYRYEGVVALHRNMSKTVFSGLVSLLIIYVSIKALIGNLPYLYFIPVAVMFFVIHAVIYLRIGGLTDYDKEIIFAIGERAGIRNIVKKLLKKLT